MAWLCLHPEGASTNYVVSVGGKEGGQKSPILLYKKATNFVEGVKIANFETAYFMDGPPEEQPKHVAQADTYLVL